METFIALLLFAGGVYCSVKTRFIQFRRLPDALRCAAPRRAGAGGISPFSAMATSLAATIGTGNIAGVAGAIVLGGPGAIFWIWASALVGMASKYADIYFGMRFRRDGCIGPMAYMSFGLPQGARPLARIYAFCCMAACLCMGNLVQINAIAEACRVALSAYALPAAHALWPMLALGMAAAATVGVIQRGGAKRIGRAASLLVPLMSALYILGATVQIVLHSHALPAAICAIFAHALEPRAFLVGIARGMFTHEAGLGTAAIAHGGADAPDAHRQALCGIFEVFFDTLVMCTLTALAVLTSGISLDGDAKGKNGALVIDAFAATIGPRSAAVFVTASLILFAFSSVLSFSHYGSTCAQFALGKIGARVYRRVFLLCLIAGTMLRISLVWRLAEWANMSMALLNVVAITVLLSRAQGPSLHQKGTRRFQSGRDGPP